MARKCNFTTPRASKKARATTHAADRASSSQDSDFNGQEFCNLEEKLTEKVDSKEESLERRAAQDRKLHARGASESLDYESSEYSCSDSETHENENEGDTENDGGREQFDDHNRDSEYISDISDDPADMPREMRNFVYRPDTPDPLAFSDDEGVEDSS